MKMALNLCDFLPQIQNPSFIMRKYQTNSNRKTFYKYLTSTPQNCKGHQKQSQSLRNCHDQDDMAIKCNVTFWIRPWNRSRTLGKTKESWINCVLDLKIMYQYWLIHCSKHVIPVNVRSNWVHSYGHTTIFQFLSKSETILKNTVLKGNYTSNTRLF